MQLRIVVAHLAKLVLLSMALSLSSGAYAQVPLNLATGWNLLGNSSVAPLDVANTFGDPSKISTVWKWNQTASKWAFYAPSMNSTVLATYAQSKGYDVLTSIAPKEGFWVNASTAVALTGPAASGAMLVEGDLQQSWNLVGSADNKTPSLLNLGLSGSLVSAGKAIVTAWAWDAPSSKWKFFAPSLEAQGGTVLADYINGKGYLPFSAALSAADGFWLNIGAASASGQGTASGSGSITIVKDAQPNDAQDFTFTSNQATIAPFLLDDDSDPTLSNQKVFANLGAGSYTFTETQVSGWNLASIVCAPSVGTTTDITTGAATIVLAVGGDITCTFTNTKVQPAPTTPDLSVTKVCAINGPQSVLCTVTVTNNGSAASVSPISLTDVLTGAPSDATYTGAGGTLPISCTPGAGPITPIACTANISLAPGESRDALFSFSLPQGGTFTNCASVSQGNAAAQPEADPANNTNICTTITVPSPGGGTFTAIDGPTLHVSTQAMTPTVLQTSTAFTSTTTGGVTTATVTAGPTGATNNAIQTLASPFPGETLVGAVATLPGSILLASGVPALSMTATNLGSSVGLVSADFGVWAITNALPSPAPANAVINYSAFAGGTLLTGSMPTSGTVTYTGKMTGVLANTPVGGSDNVSGNVSLSVNFASGTGTITGLIANIATAAGVSTITPYTTYALPINVPFNDITLTSGTGIVSGNSFAATVTTPAITGATITTMKGNFYGVGANEIAGTFTISVPILGTPGAGLILIGSFGAK